ncbi:MAG: hypothetical protein HOC23_23185, partial [Halieaceae bacterium]|nr:hypothetical protein [Halieaceae bacterium]
AHIQADRNMVGIDFDGSGLSGYDFTLGLAATKQDSIFGPSSFSLDWDGDWYGQTSQTEDYWYSELHIPWTVAPMSQATDGRKTMKMYFARVVYDESLRFAYPEASYSRPTFLTDWHPVEVEQVKSSTLDFFPYLTYGSDIENAEDEWKAGLDMVWRPDSNTQITAAINPGFGQVESDDLVVNFTAIETFFSEKRPFFTENQALFTNNVPNGDRLIHTRRIGAASDSRDETITDIDVALKLSHYGDGVDFGLFGVTEGDSRNSDGRNYLATRLQSRIDDITFGHSLTYVDRPTLDREAMVNALDMDWNYSEFTRVRGQIALSSIDEGEESEEDIMAWGSWKFAPNDEWRYSVNGSYYGEHYDMNDMGFMGRNDVGSISGQIRNDQLQYGEDSSLLSSYAYLEGTYQTNADGDRLLPWAGLVGHVDFKTTESVHMVVGAQPAGIDDLVSRGHGDVKLPAQQWIDTEYLNPRGGDYTFKLKAAIYQEGTEEFGGAVGFVPQYYVTERLTLGGSLSYEYHKEWLLWDHPSEQMATFRADHIETDIRLDWYPSTRQEVRLKFQWVGIQAEAISGFDIGGSGHLRPSGRPVEDFSLSRTALQIRYRYEIQPLSDIFLVYSRGGLWADDDISGGPWNLFQNGWDEVDAEQIIAKIRLRF